jgi:hypothetical protein
MEKSLTNNASSDMKSTSNYLPRDVHHCRATMRKTISDVTHWNYLSLFNQYHEENPACMGKLFKKSQKRSASSSWSYAKFAF